MNILIRRACTAVAVAQLLISAPRISAQEATDSPRDFKELMKSGKPPKAIRQSPPEYPLGMARAGLIGAVTVEFIIDKEGVVRNPYVVKSNNPWFERPAIDAIMKWKFQPAEMNGRKVNTRVMQEIIFNMDFGGRAPEIWQVTKGKEHDKLPPEFRWDTPPLPTNTLFPVYPLEQLKTGVEGKVRIAYIVGPDGRVLRAKLLEATTPEFGLAVLAMIDAWRFEPGRKKDGTPAYANEHIEYNFRKNGRGEVPVSDEARGILRDLEKKPENIVTAKNLDQPLKPLSRRPPVYPTALKEVGQAGEAVIEFFVDRNGEAQLPRIISSTAPEFGYAAVQAVATWRFEPPKVKGKTVVVLVRIPMEFKLPKPGAEGAEPQP